MDLKKGILNHCFLNCSQQLLAPYKIWLIDGLKQNWQQYNDCKTDSMTVNKWLL